MLGAWSQLNRVSQVMCAEPREKLPSFIRRAVERFADGVCGSQDRVAVSAAGGARNFPRRNNRLASLQKQRLDSLCNGL